MTGYPNTRSDLEIALRNTILPDAYVFLRTDSLIAAKRILPKYLKSYKEEKEQVMARIEEHKKAKDLDPFVEELHDINTHIFDVTEQDIFIEVAANIDKEALLLGDYASLIDAFTSGSVPVYEISTNKCLRPVVDLVQRRLSTLLEHVYLLR